MSASSSDTETSARQIEIDSDFLNTDGAEAEFALMVFSAAVHSYKCDSLLKPYPPMFLDDSGEKDLSSLRKTVGSMPCLKSVREGKRSLTLVQSQLLHWVLKSHRTKVHARDVEHLEHLRQLTGECLSLPEPQHLYELEYSDHHEAVFQETRSNRNIIHAYHGSRAENFHSILYHGLHAHMNKTSLFGEGTYLSVEPTVAMGFSPWGVTGWPNSALGDSMSVIALCEVIDDPSVKHKSSSSDGGVENTGTRAPNSLAGDVPDKYIVVTNNDMVRVKYLLVYTKRTRSAQPPSNDGRPSSNTQRQFSLVEWFHRHSNILPILVYIVVLIFIGLVSSKRFWRRVQQIYENTFEILGYTDGSYL